MKYGNEITAKLEELARLKGSSSKEWGVFKDQVIHAYTTAESIENRGVHPQEHLEW